MIFLLLVCSILTLVLLFYIKWLSVKQYWANRGVPYVPPNPFLGNLTFILKQNPAVWMRNIYETYKTPYVGIWLFWRPALIINSPELARNILVKDSANFRDRFMRTGATDVLGHYSLFLCRDPLWSQLRKHFTSVFTSSKLKSVHSTAISKSNELLERIKNDMKNGSVDLRQTYIDYNTDILGMASFGVTSDATLTGSGPLRKVTHDLTKFDLYRGFCWGSIHFWPELVDFFKFTFSPKSVTDYFRKVFREILAKRKEVVQDNDVHCLIDALVQLKDKNIAAECDKEDLIVAQALIFLIGGFESSSTSLAYMSYHLAFDEDMQDRLYEELMDAYQKYGNDFVSYNHIFELTYLDCILKESLRLYPPMGFLNRVALNDYQVNDNLTIKAGTSVYINANGTHYDPEYFADPDTFNPDRFLPENEKNIVPYTYMPFGEGPRNCLGRRFGELAIKSALAMVVFNYKLEPLPNSPRPIDVQIDKYSFLYSPGETLRLRFIPRTKE